MVVHELRWKQTLDELIQFRRNLKARFGLRLREEIHASPLLSKPGPLARIHKSERLEILRRYADKLASMPHLSFINVVVDKKTKPANTDVFELAWKVLVQRFENTLAHHNFAGPRNPDDMGMIFPDRSEEKKHNALLSKMRAYNPIPNVMAAGFRNLQIRCVVEDANFRDSAHSYFIQSVDVAAYMKKKSGQNYFNRLAPVLCRVATPRDPRGVVCL